MTWNTLPNVITVVRILLALSIPFFKDNTPAALILSGLFIIGDAEGWLARKLKQTSTIGAVLDKVADTTFVVIGLFFFVAQTQTEYILAGIILLSRLIKYFILHLQRKEHATSLHLKILYIITYALILLSMIHITHIALLISLAFLFILETITSIAMTKNVLRKT